jgi:hypothetical protein
MTDPQQPAPSPGEPMVPDPDFPPVQAAAGKVVLPNGKAAVVLRIGTGSATLDVMIDPRIAAQWGAGIGQAVGQAAADALQHNSGGLIVPQHQQGGGLFLPSPNGTGRVQP